MNISNHFSDQMILDGLLEKDQKILDYLERTNFSIAEGIVKRDNGNIENIKNVLKHEINNIANEIQKANKAHKNLIRIFTRIFNDESISKRFEEAWKVHNASEKIVKRIKVNNEGTWKVLYEEFLPQAIKNVKFNSGSENDAYDLLQDVFEKTLHECRDDDKYYFDIKKVISNKIKWRWIDKLRSEGKIAKTDISEAHKITNMHPMESRTKMFPNLNIIKEFWISVKYLKKMKEKCCVEEFLNYDGLNDVQEKMIEIFLDKDKTTSICKKLLLLTEFLPLADNVLIAEEMGYIHTDDVDSIKNGLNTLKTQKTRCLKKFKNSLCK